MNEQEQAKVMGQIIAKCWEDEVFKERFKTDTASVLKEYGCDTPEGIRFNVIEDSENIVNILLPRNNAELADDTLDCVAGGFTYSCAGACACASNSSCVLCHRGE